MTDDAEIQQAAEVLAAHAVLLLGAGVLIALGALGLVIGAVRLLNRYQTELRRGAAVLLEYARRVAVVERSLTRTRAFVPSGYLAVHLLLGLAVTAAIAVFVVIAENVVGGGELVAFDLAFARALRDTASPGWERLFAAVSWLGEREAIAVATLAVAARLWYTHTPVLAAGWIAAQAGGGVLNLALKQAFERTRPEYADPLLAASSWSFPSGHAMGTFILCGLGGYLWLRQVRSWTAGGALVTVLLLWCVVMAFSRLYLGAHYASDVLAGVIGGVAWVAVCASGFEMAGRRAGRRVSLPGEKVRA